MAAKDKYHELVKEALEVDGWLITHDPFYIKPEKGVSYPVDLGAEKVIVALKGPDKIVVEVKSFLEESLLHEFHGTIGQYIDYQSGLEMMKSEYELIVAIPEPAFDYLWSFEVIRRSSSKINMKILVYSIQQPKVLQWIR
jgi:XisH protein